MNKQTTKKQSIMFVIVVTIAVFITMPIVYGQTTVNTTDFSIDIPDNWAYQRSTLYKSQVTSSPSEFSTLLVKEELGTLLLGNIWGASFGEKMKDGGVFSSFNQDSFDIKNAPLDAYVEYKIYRQDGMNVTSKQNVTIGNETAVKIYADGIGSFNGTKIVQYLAMHDKQHYVLNYMANVKDFEKYLPEFEQIVKTFKFVK
jgi:hypothetical protein